MITKIQLQNKIYFYENWAFNSYYCKDKLRHFKYKLQYYDFNPLIVGYTNRFLLKFERVVKIILMCRKILSNTEDSREIYCKQRDCEENSIFWTYQHILETELTIFYQLCRIPNNEKDEIFRSNIDEKIQLLKRLIQKEN